MHLLITTNLHKERKVPGDNLSAYTNRLMTSVAMEVSVQGDNLTMVFIRPTSKVTVTFYTKYIKDIKQQGQNCV